MNRNRNHSIQGMSYIVVFMLLIAYLLMSVHVSAQPKFDHILEVEVNVGDTLWSISSQYSDRMTVPAYISLVKAENNLKDHNIYPGQVLLLPQIENKEVSTAHEHESNYLLSSKH
ncbi:LysM peptidoglycan-binding domain-containing protein [Anaerobacillus sp. CMMVII]|uniref:cell division suppressor protein YneA n=1 Tax=Anaerobacillus sp. CMMVII TaxID=2755588 RepID=UPI0021B7DC19|nr:LysM peptidoglycan-binding domain-containing protein [Anaerobacillus sp. CMMVII]MCT8139905.1 LysM peptidoglycan-binding domain-containing protein [Anaerobacillus sp. CMMVII]